MDDNTKQLLALWQGAEEEAATFQGDIPATIDIFRETAGGWTVDLFTATRDDNGILAFTHPDFDDIFIHVYTNDDPYFSPLNIDRANGIYSHDLPAPLGR